MPHVQVGAGKSTLLLHLLGEMRPMEGQICLRIGKDTSKVCDGFFDF